MAHGLLNINLLKTPSILIPLFLCPSLASCANISHDFRRLLSRPRRHHLHVDNAATPSHGFATPLQLLNLPRSCPGCGAFTQIVSPEQPGFYGTNRKSVKAFIGRNGQRPSKGYDGESKLFEHVIEAADASLLSQMGLQGGGGENNKNSKMSCVWLQSSI